MTMAQTVRCKACNGTGVSDDGRCKEPSQNALLRREVAKAWNIVAAHEQFLKSIYETSQEAITGLVKESAKKDAKIAELQQIIGRMKSELGVYKDRMNDDDSVGKGSDADGEAGEEEEKEPKQKMTRREYRRAVIVYEAQKSGLDPKAAAAEAQKKKKKTGAQKGHKWTSRKGKVDETVRIQPELCDNCGRFDGMKIKSIRKPMRDLGKIRRTLDEMMYVKDARLCPQCLFAVVPPGDDIPGTSFGPNLRAHIHTYRDKHATEGDMRTFLAGIEDATFSKGTISACISAIAAHEDGPVLALPDEQPIVLDDNDLREFRSPVRPPPPDDSEYGRLDAILTQRSTLWTSSRPQPVMVRIIQRASMDPYASTDESSNRIGGVGVQTSVAETTHTTQVRIIKRRDADTLHKIWGWLKHRPAMRDGTRGYEWHSGKEDNTDGDKARCGVHLLRDAEDSSMENNLGSPQYVRHQEMLDIYIDANRVRKIVMDRAGGPLTCASQLGHIHKVRGLVPYIEQETHRLTDRVQNALEMAPPDAVTTTVSNALPHMFTPLRVPGMPLHNNGNELSIRDNVVIDRRRIAFPDSVGAYNFSVMKIVPPAKRTAPAHTRPSWAWQKIQHGTSSTPVYLRRSSAQQGAKPHTDSRTEPATSIVKFRPPTGTIDQYGGRVVAAWAYI